MKFQELSLSGSYLIELDQMSDNRGFFARSFCKDEFFSHQLKQDIQQSNISFNLKKGTVRGMHFQLAPYGEEKLVRCTMGRIFDVIVDMRPDSKSYLQWVGVELSVWNRNMLYIPTGFAHGFQTLEDNVEVSYQMFCKYESSAASGVRWNDPSINVRWPLPVSVISEKDLSYSDINDE